MPSISEVLAYAIQQHQAGQVQAAEELYRQILAVDPTCVDAWNLLGVMATQLGQYQQAVQFISQALQLQPASAELHYNLGSAWHRLGKLTEAAAAYQRAVEFDPNDGRPLNNLGNVLYEQGNVTDAIAYHRRACDLNADDADAFFNLANDYKFQKNWDDAVVCYERAIALRPDWAEALSNLGDARQGRGDLDGAIANYRSALALLPASAEILSNLGGALENQGDIEGAIVHFRRAVELGPDLPAAQLNLGMALHKQCRMDEAVPWLRKASELTPDSAEAQNALGLALRDQGKHEEATACFRRSLELKPDLADARTNYAIMLLSAGEFAAGWAEYEWRWQTTQCPPREFGKPRWNGEPLEGRTILLSAEQGLGDTLEFIRYAPLIKELGANVIVECQKALVPLLSRCPGIDRLVGRGDEPPDFDVHAPLLSLPRLLRTEVGTVPANIPYVFPEAQRVRHWRERLRGCAGLRIGINWRGRAGQGTFRQRDIPLDCFRSFCRQPVTLVSLQQAASEQELSEAFGSGRFFLPGEDFDRDHGAFVDTAAIMMNLDLIITSDTSVPHLAGAMGAAVWIALPYVASWQWMRDRSDTPWYPTARLFRQTSPGHWEGVFAEMDDELRRFMDRSEAV